MRQLAQGGTERDARCDNVLTDALGLTEGQLIDLLHSIRRRQEPPVIAYKAFEGAVKNALPIVGETVRHHTNIGSPRGRTI